MSLAPWILAFVAAQATPPQTSTVVIAVEAMHCDECREALEFNLRAIRGVTEVRASESGATLRIDEKQGLRYRSLASALPSDLKLKSITVTMRGIVSPAAPPKKIDPNPLPGLEFRCKGSGQLYHLANKDEKSAEKKEDWVAALSKTLAKPPKYVVTGELVERDKHETILLSELPAKTTWKDEK